MIRPPEGAVGWYATAYLGKGRDHMRRRVAAPDQRHPLPSLGARPPAGNREQKGKVSPPIGEPGGQVRRPGADGAEYDFAPD